MLQWMGGSRRKVTTSRKSTHNRQKQYFEQRKRQQQTTGSENHAHERSKRFHYYEEPRSLDVLSLNNLAAITRRDPCGVKNEDHISQVKASEIFPEFLIKIGTSASRDRLKEMKDDVSQENIKASESFPEFPSNRGKAASNDYLKDLKKSSCSEKGSLNLKNFSAETVHDSPGISSGRNFSTKAHDKLDERKMSSFSNLCNVSKSGAKADELKKISENQLSVLDLLSDDQTHSKSEGLPSGEAHVAFSVKGLGKVRMETPVHSPGQVESFHSPTMMASGWMPSAQNIPNDIGLKLNTMDEIRFSAGDSPLVSLSDTWDMKDCLFNSDGFRFNGKGGMPLDADAYQTQDDFFTRNKYLHNSEIKNEVTREDRFGVFEDFLGTKYGMPCDEQTFHMDFDVSKFPEIKNSAAYDRGIGDTFLQNRRSAEAAWEKNDVSDAPDSYLRHSTPIESYDFVNFDLKRSLHFVRKPSGWSFSTADDATDNISLLSEESCSSAAVRNERACNLVTDLVKVKQNNGIQRVNNSKKKSDMMTFPNGALHVDINELTQDKDLVRTENNWTISTKLKTKARHFSENSPAINTSIGADCISFSSEDLASSDIDLAPSLSYKSCMKTDTVSVDCKFKSDDEKFNLFKVSQMHPYTDSSRRISTPGNHVKHDPPGNIHLEKNVLRQPLEHAACLTSLHALKTEDFHRDQSYCAKSQKDVQFPYIARVQENCKDDKVSDFQLKDCEESLEKLQNEIPAGKSRLSSGNGRNVVVAESRDHCSEHKKPPESSEPSEVRNIATMSNVSLAMVNVPTSVQCISGQLYMTVGLEPSSHQSYNKELRKENYTPENDNFKSMGESKADTSYQLMLESYVLQLLCVQKVLMESSKQEKHYEGKTSDK